MIMAQDQAFLCDHKARSFALKRQEMRYLVAFTVLLFVQTLDLPSAQLGKASLQKPPWESRSKIICIDPGHPSEVNDGKTVQNGTSEVHIAWVTALKLQKLLEAKGYEVVLTKAEENQLVRNKERALVANRAHAALTIRLHCDAFAGRGFAVYYPDRQGTKEGKTGPSEDVMRRSLAAAAAIHAGMVQVMEGVLKDRGILGDSKTLIGSKQGALTGSIFSEVPIVTVEMVVLSDRQDAEFIKSEDGQQQVARAIAEGIERFVN
jgi:N-acetylmuramoyl-L-alanine amidase